MRTEVAAPRTSARVETETIGAGGERLLVLVPLALTALVYGSITRNYFYADDFFNLFQIANESPLEFVLTPSGGHVLVARNAIFYVSALLFGTEPASYFWTVLATHLLNVWLVHRLLRLQAASPRIACFGAALWGICPLDAGSLTWYSVYGHVVATAALLGALCLFGGAAARGESPSRSRWVAAFALALVAATSFGFGTGAAAILPFLLLLLFPGLRTGAVRGLPPLASLLGVVPGLYLGLVRLYSLLYGTNLDMVSWLRTQAGGQGFAIARALARCAAFGASRLIFGLFVPPTAEPP